MTLSYCSRRRPAIATLALQDPPADIEFFLGNVPGNLDTILFDAADDGSDMEILGKSNEGWDVLLTGRGKHHRDEAGPPRPGWWAPTTKD